MKSFVRALMLFCIALTTAAVAQQAPAAGRRMTPEKRLKLKREVFAPARKLLLKKHVPFNPDELLNPGWSVSLKDALASTPEMHVTRYETKPLKGVYLADTLYLPGRPVLAGETVILVNHLVFEDTFRGLGRLPIYQVSDQCQEREYRPACENDTADLEEFATFKGGREPGIHIFHIFPMEQLGKSLREVLQQAGLPVLQKNAPPPSFDQLIQALHLDPYRHGKRYEWVFLNPPIFFLDASGRPGAPGVSGAPGANGGRSYKVYPVGRGANETTSPQLPPPPPPN